MSGELPEGWSWLTLEQFAATEPHAITDGPFGSNLKTADYVEGGEVRVIRLGNIGVGRFVDEDRSFISAAKFAGLTKHEARAGDLVVAALAEPVGRCAEVPEGIGTAIVKADCVRVRVNPRFDRRYLMHALNSPAGRLRAEAAAHGMGRLRMNLGDLRNLVVPTAPPTEQHRIVAKLEALQARSRRAKEALDTVPALLEKLRQSILAAAFRGDLTKDWRAQNPNVEPASELLKRIRAERRAKWEEAELAKLKAKGKTPSDDKWKAKYKEPEPVDTAGLPELPSGWCWATFAEVGSIAANLVDPSQFPDALHVAPDNVARDTGALLAVQTVAHDRVISGNHRFFLGQIIYSKIRPYLNKCAIAPFDGLCSADMYPIDALINVRFLHFFMLSLHFLAQISDRAGSRVVLPKANQDQLNAVMVPVPPLDEQAAISEHVALRLHVASGVAASCRSIEQLAQQLAATTLAKAFRGELVPQKPDDP